VTPDPIKSIERGAVFLLAEWSTPSKIALYHLQRAWSAAGLPESELHVLDWDTHSYLGELPELSRKVHGWGEAFHVRHGRVVHFSVLGRTAATLDQCVRDFLLWVVTERK
jgi:hypothetical protein